MIGDINAQEEIKDIISQKLREVTATWRSLRKGSPEGLSALWRGFLRGGAP